MSIQLKKRQHYVWQHYLKAWQKEDSIQCLNKTTIFPTSSKNIAVEKNIYVPNDVTVEEIKFLSELFLPNSENTDFSTRKSLNDNWNTIFNFLVAAEKTIKKNSEVPKEIQNRLRNIYEDIQSNIEHLGQSSLNKLKNSHDKLNDQDIVDFVNFITYQFLRTKKSRELISSTNNNYNQYNLEKLWPLLIHYMATQLSFGIIQNWGNYCLVSFINNTERSLITGDQPIVLTSSPSIKNESPDDFILYYPISPKKAINLTTNKFQSKIIELTSSDISMYNQLIFCNKLHQVYSNDSYELELVRENT